jgi:hypothetical protein
MAILEAEAYVQGDSSTSFQGALAAYAEASVLGDASVAAPAYTALVGAASPSGDASVAASAGSLLRGVADLLNGDTVVKTTRWRSTFVAMPRCRRWWARWTMQPSGASQVKPPSRHYPYVEDPMFLWWGSLKSLQGGRWDTSRIERPSGRNPLSA